jgi:hypothetical protein
MRKILLITALIMMISVLLTAQNSFAFYKWVDDAGQTHISDQPKPGTSSSENIADTSNATIYVPNSSLPRRPIPMNPMPFHTITPPVSFVPQNEIQQPTVRFVPQQQINRPQFDRAAAERALDQALDPLVRLIAKIILIVLIHMTLFILTLMHIMKNEFTNNTNKILWVIIVLSLPLLGIILYYFIGRSQIVGQDLMDKDLEMPRRRPRELDM